MAVQPLLLSVYNLLYVIAGGALGAALRFGVSGVAIQIGRGSFPWGTLFVNVVGSLLAGFIWGILDQASPDQRTQAFFIVGLCGAFTTFSAYALDSLRLFQENETGLAILNVLGNNVGSLLAVFAGFGLAKWLFQQVV